MKLFLSGLIALCYLGLNFRFEQEGNFFSIYISDIFTLFLSYLLGRMYKKNGIGLVFVIVLLTLFISFVSSFIGNIKITEALSLSFNANKDIALIITSLVLVSLGASSKTVANYSDRKSILADVSFPILLVLLCIPSINIGPISFAWGYWFVGGIILSWGFIDNNLSGLKKLTLYLLLMYSIANIFIGEPRVGPVNFYLVHKDIGFYIFLFLLYPIGFLLRNQKIFKYKERRFYPLDAKKILLAYISLCLLLFIFIITIKSKEAGEFRHLHFAYSSILYLLVTTTILAFGKKGILISLLATVTVYLVAGNAHGIDNLYNQGDWYDYEYYVLRFSFSLGTFINLIVLSLVFSMVYSRKIKARSLAVPYNISLLPVKIKLMMVISPVLIGLVFLISASESAIFMLPVGDQFDYVSLLAEIRNTSIFLAFLFFVSFYYVFVVFIPLAMSNVIVERNGIKFNQDNFPDLSQTHAKIADNIDLLSPFNNTGVPLVNKKKIYPLYIVSQNKIGLWSFLSNIFLRVYSSFLPYISSSVFNEISKNDERQLLFLVYKEYTKISLNEYKLAWLLYPISVIPVINLFYNYARRILYIKSVLIAYKVLKEQGIIDLSAAIGSIMVEETEAGILSPEKLSKKEEDRGVFDVFLEYLSPRPHTKTLIEYLKAYDANPELFKLN